MPKLTDPDSYSVYVHPTSAAGATTEEIVILTGPKTIQLRVAGNLDDTAPGASSGATAKSVYSFLKEEYLSGVDSATLRRFRFPLKMIFEGSFIWVNGWAPADQQTRDLFRDAGFQEQVSGNQNACMISLNQMDNEGVDLAYYKQAAGFTAAVTDYDKTGQLNENVDITGSLTYFKSFLREQGKLYSEYDLLAEYGIAAITFQAYFFPLPNGNDAKVVESDANIDTLAPYTGMKVNYLLGNGFTTAAATTYAVADVVQDGTGRWAFCTGAGTVVTPGGAFASFGGTSTWEAYDGEELIGSTYYAFNRVVTGNGGTNDQIHSWNMRQLRKSTDINANDTPSIAQRGFGAVNGNVALLLDEYVGDTMVMAPGVVVRGFDANSTNNIQHQPIVVDSGGVDTEGFPVAPPTTPTSFPFVAAGSLNFASNIVNELDAETYYNMYFDYIVRTAANTTIAVGTPTGNQAAITWTGTVLDHLQTGDYVKFSGFSNSVNNGLWFVDSTGANTLTATKQDVAPVAEVAGASVTSDENPFESPGAIIVNDNSATPITGQVTGSSIAFDFDYTNNNQGGRTPNQDAPVVVVAQALDGAEWAEASATLTASVGISIPINPNDERNYENAA